jgi:bacteriocin biosynthesis cyclodehydratase domain-containing protein
MSSSDPLQLADAIHFKDVFGVFVLSPDDVEFRTGATSGKSFVVSDAEKRGLVGSVIARILSPQVAQTRPWNKAESELLRELIPQLQQNGIVECDGKASMPPIMNEGHDFSIPVLRRPLTEAHIGIVGHGVLGEAVRLILRDVPCGSITVVESSSVAKASRLKVLERPLAQAARTPQTPVAGPTDELGWVETVKGHDWIIAAQDSFEPEELEALNKAAMQLDVPWSLVCFDGYEGWVGPTFLPGQTACFSCFRKRLFAGAAEPKHVFTDPSVKVYRVPAPWSVGPETSAWVSLIASMFALEVIGVMNGHGFTLNHLLIVHRLNLTFQRESVLRLPRCQDCSRRRNAPRLNVFSHVLTARAPRGEAKTDDGSVAI